MIRNEAAEQAGGSTGSDDRALPFQVEGLDVRGRVVTLGSSIDAILQRHDFPAPVKRLVGEAAVLASLLATSLKDVGRFILQTQTDGPVSMIVVDVRTPGQIRATATFNETAVAKATADGRADPAILLGSGTLAMTVEQGHTQQRYQGYVPLEEETLEAAAHTYFRRSEQIPTRIRLAVAEMYDRDERGAARRSWRAGGIIGQFLPLSEERIRQRDLPGGDLPEGAELAPDPAEDDAWVEAQALIDTVEDHELTDPSIAAERLLYRLFHERGVRVFEPISLEENCSCSRARIEQVLREMGPAELEESVVDGSIEVRCEFCGTHYRFDAVPFTSAQS
ncbi:MAG TPA: Hsp33 family molecular chaperone [Propylenella sp.]